MRPLSLPARRLTCAVALFTLAAVPASAAPIVSLGFWDLNDAVPPGGVISQPVRDALFSADGGIHLATATMTSNFNL